MRAIAFIHVSDLIETFYSYFISEKGYRDMGDAETDTQLGGRGS
jgi:hypothetical protein